MTASNMETVLGNDILKDNLQANIKGAQGAISYEVISNEQYTGTATIDDPGFKSTKPGKVKVKVTAEATSEYAAGTVEFEVNIAKATPEITLNKKAFISTSVPGKDITPVIITLHKDNNGTIGDQIEGDYPATKGK